MTRGGDSGARELSSESAVPESVVADVVADSEAMADPSDGELAEDDLRQAFGVGWPAMQRFHQLLAEEGETLGLVGPKEVSRLWSRHLVNCGAVASMLPPSVDVIDVGSGAGLPGLVLAAMRPDCRFELVEPMARRCDWLERCVVELGLRNVVVTRARAEELPAGRTAEVVTARAVAQLAKLIGWAWPLVAEGGSLLAIKGARAADEVEAARKVLRREGLTAGVSTASLLTMVPPTRVVVVTEA